MTRTQEIIRHIKKVRGENGAFDIRTGNGRTPSPLGGCLNSAEIARKMHGQHWRSEEARVRPEQAYPGHSVAVVRTGRKSGVIVDYSDPKHIVKGAVRDVTDAHSVEKDLTQATGFTGWRRQK